MFELNTALIILPFVVVVNHFLAGSLAKILLPNKCAITGLALVSATKHGFHNALGIGRAGCLHNHSTVLHIGRANKGTRGFSLTETVNHFIILIHDLSLF